jgi:SAM-dependent methyltransferase
VLPSAARAVHGLRIPKGYGFTHERQFEITGGSGQAVITTRSFRAMKLRDSGMPAEAYWETLFDVSAVLDRLGIDCGVGDVVELGCGYGTFTLPVARKISGTLRTFDIESQMVIRTRQRAVSAGIPNIIAGVRDVFAEGFGVPDASQDACLLFNILHCEEPQRLLAEAARILRSGGRLLVIHWRADPATPRGPAMDIRPTPQQISEWAGATGSFESPEAPLQLPPWHFGLSFIRNMR